MQGRCCSLGVSRRRSGIFCHPLLLASIALTCGLSLSASAETYSVTSIIPAPSQGKFTIATGINNSGQVVGIMQLNGGTGGSEDVEGFVYTAGTLNPVAPMAGYLYSAVSAINNLGEITGTNSTGFATTSFSQTATQTTNLGTLGGDSSTATAINSSGVIVGQSYTTTPAQTEAFVYSNGVMTGLGFNGGNNSAAYGINDSGYIVGSYQDASNVTQAFVYDPSNQEMTNIGNLGDNTDNYSAEATAINNAGDIVGDSDTASGDHDAFEYIGKTMIDLGNLGSGFSSANSINNLGQIVGNSDDANYDSVGFIYENGTMIDLNSLLAPGSGWEITNALGINDSGQIAAEGVNISTGQIDALLLTPGAVVVPTPSAALGGIGLLALLGLRKRRTA